MNAADPTVPSDKANNANAKSNDIDFDVIVVGGGPAGLAAAIRTRWVKGHGAIPLETAVFESGVPGGLAAWRGIFLTGPSFYLQREDLTGRLLADCKNFEIPIFNDRVVGAKRTGDVWQVTTASGRTLRSAALIVATGLRSQGKEAPLFSHGVYVTYMGYDHLWRLFRQIPQTRGTEHPILVVGNEHTALLASVFSDIAAETDARFRFLLDFSTTPGSRDTQDDTQHEKLRADLAAKLPGELLNGHYSEIVDDNDNLTATWHDREGGEQHSRVAAVIIDYNAFEIRPDFCVHGDLGRDETGFMIVDRNSRTSLPFLYAAGDITGGYAMALGAMSEGAHAGFAAYEDLYRARFKEEPSLFAYKPKSTAITRDYRALPKWLADDWIKPLISPQRLGEFRLATEVDPKAWLSMDGFFYRQLSAELGDEAASCALDGWVERKVVTVRRVAVDVAVDVALAKQSQAGEPQL